jgi:hypothetical protein
VFALRFFYRMEGSNSVKYQIPYSLVKAEEGSKSNTLEKHSFNSNCEDLLKRI